jgi:hypothetical protein
VPALIFVNFLINVRYHIIKFMLFNNEVCNQVCVNQCLFEKICDWYYIKLTTYIYLCQTLCQQTVCVHAHTWACTWDVCWQAGMCVNGRERETEIF